MMPGKTIVMLNKSRLSGTCNILFSHVSFIISHIDCIECRRRPEARRRVLQNPAATSKLDIDVLLLVRLLVGSEREFDFVFESSSFSRLCWCQTEARSPRPSKTDVHHRDIFSPMYVAYDHIQFAFQISYDSILFTEA